jgi:hypothetical protein
MKKITIITEMDLETGHYEVTFRNKSDPGQPMDLNLIKAAWKKVSEDFTSAKKAGSTPTQVLN